MTIHRRGPCRRGPLAGLGEPVQQVRSARQALRTGRMTTAPDKVLAKPRHRSSAGAGIGDATEAGWFGVAMQSAF